MAMTMTQKLLAKAAGKQSVVAGELISCKLDLVLGNDITAPVAIAEFERLGAESVFDNTKIALIPDHFTPNKDIASAQLAKTMREFANFHNILHYYEVGRCGIEHALLPELGLIKPGDVIIGADSHTCTYGALGAFATGVGSTDMAAAMATGECWFKVPEAIKVNITGEFNEFVSGKDLILKLIGQIGVDGARYASLEFIGARGLTIDDRFTVANMAIEAGAKNGIFPADECALAYTREHAPELGITVCADDDAQYTQTIDINLSEVDFTIAFPHLPENTHTASDAQKMDIKIDQAVIGSCTNGRFSDMLQAANMLKGKKIHKNVRCIVIPATQKIFMQCVNEGLAQIFIDAGCVFSTPTCGPCLGGHMGVLAKGERCISTTNRNFVGRMGHKNSEVYLASPVVAAASAIAGSIVSPLSL